MPSRRCPCSISAALPTVRVVAPTPLAMSDQPAPIPRPTDLRGLDVDDFFVDLRGVLTVRVVRDLGLDEVEPPRTPVLAVDVVVLEPRALALPAMAPRLVATAPSGPSATPVTRRDLR
ncbi:MAG: hypothetical protein EOP26_09920 [Rhodococcus sp. (in: high G+C Gram-positive bacteria)]|nr:MAG: hypothetical protein EOP26_09920 [Rhodococcus sp. (in: high G+C Gram-positive bacteria)]